MSTDHLVLRIDEVGKDCCFLDVMFIFYDPVTHMYAIRGKAAGSKSIPYSFSCETRSDVMDFIRAIFYIVKGADEINCNISLINYSDLPFDSDEVNYDMLNCGHTRRNELMGLDGSRLERNVMERYLRILRYVRNEYVEY
jgi:hypothetical protein